LAQLHQDDKPVLIYSTSIYVWDGKRQRDTEAAMIIKTRARLADTAIAEARRLHPYSNPAFVTMPVDGGSDDFLRWIMEQTSKRA
jgi:periplasmic divalent cation tolerance protein